MLWRHHMPQTAGWQLLLLWTLSSHINKLTTSRSKVFISPVFFPASTNIQQLVNWFKWLNGIQIFSFLLQQFTPMNCLYFSETIKQQRRDSQKLSPMENAAFPFFNRNAACCLHYFLESTPRHRPSRHQFPLWLGAVRRLTLFFIRKPNPSA